MSKNKKILVFCAIAVVLIAVIVVLVFAFSKGQEYYRFLEVREYSGSVAFERDGKNHELFEGIHLVSKDKIITGAASDILLLADLDKHIFAEENTAFIIEAEGKETEGRIAIHKNRLIKISFHTRKSQRITHYYLPERIEYSSKNDKFRVHVIRYNKSRPVERGVINLSQINSAELTDIVPVGSLQGAPPKRKAVIRVKDERNAINRFMMEFAELERVSEFDDETKECIVTMKYESMDETEILIRILSFGPVVEVLKPETFREKIAHRIRNQRRLSFGEDLVR